jgi:hypothetical protein
MSAMNDVIDLHQERITVATQQRMPLIFWMALFLLTLLTMMLAGYHAGRAGEKRSLSSIAVAIAFSIVFILVVVLDRPLHKLNIVNQAPFLICSRAYARLCLTSNASRLAPSPVAHVDTHQCIKPGLGVPLQPFPGGAGQVVHSGCDSFLSQDSIAHEV